VKAQPTFSVCISGEPVFLRARILLGQPAGGAGARCRQEWQHGTSGDVRHVAWRADSCRYGLTSAAVI